MNTTPYKSNVENFDHGSTLVHKQGRRNNTYEVIQTSFNLQSRKKKKGKKNKIKST